ncbi:hypothetical protein BKA65DRAFT_486076 [Rhexocercosporidium sp. MPI-PUGE-AT-0058]|nr:hypothetical protein BKA65DRAFT_486076 [Rhexocercosporidium sp. MPI-PUGE-AT-0058]
MKFLGLVFFALSVNATPLNSCTRVNACRDRSAGGVVDPGQNCRPPTDYCTLGACGIGQTCHLTDECEISSWLMKSNYYSMFNEEVNRELWAEQTNGLRHDFGTDSSR